MDLFHARFVLGDRIRIESEAIERFGRASHGLSRNRVLVATQVVEQSLDLDFDVMVTDLAPIDLLIQRAGRLHRHDHRADRPAPVLHILSPDPTGDAGASWFAGMFPKGQYVYRDHGQVWLTMRHLIDAGGLNLLSASPRVPIEAVLSERGTPPIGLTAVSGKAAGEAAAQRGIATLNALALGTGYAMAAGSWASDEITPTRLGAPQRTVRLARWDGTAISPWSADADPLRAWRLSEVQVLAARVSKVDVAGEPLMAAIAAVVASWPETFEPPLLLPLQKFDGVWQCQVIGAEGRGSKMGQPARLEYSSEMGLRFV